MPDGATVFCVCVPTSVDGFRKNLLAATNPFFNSVRMRMHRREKKPRWLGEMRGWRRTVQRAPVDEVRMCRASDVSCASGWALFNGARLQPVVSEGAAGDAGAAGCWDGHRAAARSANPFPARQFAVNVPITGWNGLNAKGRLNRKSVG